jgi:hypothetical protein
MKNSLSIEEIGVEYLNSTEMNQVTGGNAVGYFIGFAIGYTFGAVVAGIKLVTGNL